MTDIDKLLHKQTPTPSRPLCRDFTNNVIVALADKPPEESWRKFIEVKIMKLKHLPKPALAALTATGLIAISGTAYAAINWFGTSVQTSQNDNVVTVRTKACPTRSDLPLPNQKPRSNSEGTYKIVKPELIKAEDIQTDHLVNCEQLALQALSAKHFPDSYNFDWSNYQAPEGKWQMPTIGDWQLPADNYGTIESIGDSAIVIADVHINRSPLAADHKTVTLQIRPETVVVNQGKTILLGDLRLGDQVYFSFQNPASHPDHPTTLDAPQPGSRLLLLAKTQYDYRISDKVAIATIPPNNALEFIKFKTDEPHFGG